MRINILPLAAVFAATVAFNAQAGLLLSEVVFNEVGSDVTGEWIEIFNTGPGAIDLTNYKIGDEETSGGTSATEAMHQFPAGASIGSGQLQIVAVSASRFFTVYGILPTYEINETDVLVPNMLPYATWDTDGGVLNMSNTNDQAVILDGTDSIVDAASWGSSTFAFNPALGSAMDGQSYERKNSYFDNNTANDWQTVPGDAAADRSTPFSANVPEPAALVMLTGIGLAIGLCRRR
jgi:Lamin Tail Domain